MHHACNIILCILPATSWLVVSLLIYYFPGTVLDQEDTFFKAPNGRLKVRIIIIITIHSAKLISLPVTCCLCMCMIVWVWHPHRDEDATPTHY